MVLIYINRAKEKAFFFFLKTLTSFQELVCFSLVTLSFEIQPSEAIPVEIRTDTRGFDSNAALSPTRCLAGAQGRGDGTGRAGGQPRAPRPAVPNAVGVSAARSPAAGSFNLAWLSRGEGPRDRTGGRGRAEGSGHAQSRELSRLTPEGMVNRSPEEPHGPPRSRFSKLFSVENSHFLLFWASFGISAP